MRLSITSDLHIQSADDPLYRSFLAWLDQPEHRGPGARIVLAGDIFDLFVGNKVVFVQRYREFFDRLRALGSLGARIDYIEGNHDFWIAEAFSGIPAVTVHSGEVALTLGDRRFLIAHGDLVDRDDHGYLALRGLFRSSFMHGLVNVIPGTALDAIGRSMSRASGARKPRLPEALPGKDLARLRAAYHAYARAKISDGYDFVICGHCHDLDEAWLRAGSREGQYINVGYPRAHGSVLSWVPGEKSVSRRALAP